MLEGFSGGLIVALVDFIMVFLVLGGLYVTIRGLDRIMAQWERKTAVPAAPPGQKAVAPPEKDRTMTTHIAAILAALQKYTGLAPGSFKIDAITPCETTPIMTPNATHVAAISAAIHACASSAEGGSFRITGITHLGRASSWKMAGRMESMGFEQ